MRFKIVLSAVTSLALVSGGEAGAGGCYREKVTHSKAEVAKKMANLVRDQVLEIERSLAARGVNNLKVVLVARQGESLDGFRVILDDPNVPLEEQLDTIAAKALSPAQHGEVGVVDPATDRKVLPFGISKPNDIDFSHLGFLLKQDPLGHRNGKLQSDWTYISHLLAKCESEAVGGTGGKLPDEPVFGDAMRDVEGAEGKNLRYGTSRIFFHALPQFFWDTNFLDSKRPANKALILVPSSRIQDRLYDVIINRRLSVVPLHTPNYNVAATPYRLRPRISNVRQLSYFQTTDQNSNQFPLELIAAAQRPLGTVLSRVQAQEVLLKTNYRPSLLTPNPFSFKGVAYGAACDLYRASFFGLTLWDASKILSCEDQTYKDFNVIQIITVNSVRDYMKRANLLEVHAQGSSELGSFQVEIDLDTVRELDRTGRQMEELSKKLQDAFGERDGARVTPRRP